MSLYAISDLHLSLSIDKPMDIFGPVWENYIDKIRSSWEELIDDDDTVVIPGDISWATYLDEAYEDFKFIDGLPGRKIILKGNHDYWWTTMNKLGAFLQENSFKTISFINNNSYVIGNVAVCGTRGWKCPGDEGFGAQDRKIYEREIKRLELSVKSLKEQASTVVAALHYPPFNLKRDRSGFVEILENLGINKCIYGHLHDESHRLAFNGNLNGIEYRLVAADYLGFVPILIEP